VDFPESVVGYFQGQLGQPPGGFPEKLRTAILKGLPVIQGRPGASMKPMDLEARAADLSKRLGRKVSRVEAISHALYPRVMDDFFEQRVKYEDLSILDTPTYFYGLDVGQERWVELEPGKTLVLSLQAVSDATKEGVRTVFFELNGHGRQVLVRDKALAPQGSERRLADKGNARHVGASMPGVVIAVHSAVGAEVAAGAPLLTLEAMKMETIVRAPQAGTVKELLPALKAKVVAGELLAVLAD
jgi:pyruvate carboxylase